MNSQNTVSRRNFIKGLGLASGGLLIASSANILTSCTPKELIEINPNLFVQLTSNGDVTLLATRSEMGQGIRTAITSIIADEMEADWNKVQVIQAKGDKKVGDQNTDGSKSVRLLYEKMRSIGAGTKALLIASAAKKWDVPATECHAESHFVYHSSGKKIGYGDLVEIAKNLEIPTGFKLKENADFKYIGKKLPSIDVQKFTTGAAKFGLDIRVPFMQHAAIQRCPVAHGKVKSFDKSEALKVDGVINVIEIPHIRKPFGSLGGVAVIAKNTWAAFKGRDALKIEWDYGANEDYDSKKFNQELTKSSQRKGKVEKSTGDFSKAFKRADKTVTQTYLLPHLSHAPMEVPNAVVSVQENKCEIWAPTQAPQRVRKEIAKLLKIDEENVTVNVTFLGGGFGRKAKPDYVIEAAIISKEIKAPVQVVWSREDDIRHGYFHTVSAQHMQGAIDKNGKVTGWLHRSAMPTISSTFSPKADELAKWETRNSVNVPFDIPNMQIETGKAKAHVRIGWFRSVINVPHGFAINVFADELAHKAGVDPLEFRLSLIGEDRIEKTNNAYKYDTAKLKHVLKQAAKNAGWGKQLPKGHGLGLAVHYSFFTYVASVVEVSVIDDNLKVHNVHTVIDCGTAINKDTIEAQMEGSAIFGMSLAFYGKITAKDGAIEQSNFHDYQMVRLPDAPKVHVEIIESTSKPTGVGEPGVPVIAPAIVNAIFSATGKRYRSLPLSDHGLV